MTALAPTLQSFFTRYLIEQKGASPHTITAYRDTFRLLLAFTQQRTGTRPAKLDITDLTADLIADFLTDLEHTRGNTTRTRNTRLAAIHSLFQHAALRHPEDADHIAHVLAIPAKRTHHAEVTYLSEPEIAALLAAPDRSTPTGRRDHLILLIMITTGLRVSELTALTRADIAAPPAAHLRCTGKGRKDRTTPISAELAAAITTFTNENPGAPADPLFTAHGTRRNMSTDAIAQRLTTHTKTAAVHSPTLASRPITPHVLRHTCAMRMLAAGIDATTISLWLGHASPESTRPYLHADLALKQRALDRTKSPHIPAGRYRPPDTLLAFLEAL